MSFPYLVAGGLVVAGLYLLARWLSNADPKMLARHLRWAALVLGALIALILYVSGRLGLVLVLSILMAVAITNWRAIAGLMKSAAGPAPGQTSTIATDFLDVSLDHDSGEMAGTVRKGVHEGRDLNGMSLEELLLLRGECVQDAKSVSILDAFLDRRFGHGWRDEGEPGEPPSAGSDRPMTREEAFRFLGLEPDASPQQIKDAHRRLMKNFHPDHGGSDHIAAKLNEAKSILLDD